MENVKVTVFRDIIIIILLLLLFDGKYHVVEELAGLIFCYKKESSSEMSTKLHRITNNKTAIKNYNELIIILHIKQSSNTFSICIYLK